jgi:uncharacterized protein (TIGR03437 family)
MRSVALARWLLVAAIAPAAHGYVRSVFNYSDGTSVPQRRADNSGIQFYMNSAIAPNLQSSASGQPVTVISAGSDPVGAIKAALSTWSSVSGANLKFLPVKTTDKGSDPNDGQMTIVIGSTASDLSIVGASLAVTVTQASTDPGASGVIVDSDIIFNPAIKFSTDFSAANDFQSVLTHELGHSLGMNHSGLLGAVMYFQTTSVAGRYLTADEAGFAAAVYPGTNNGLGTLSGKVLASDGSPVSSGLVTLLDTTAGISLSALTAQDGTYSIQALPGNYVVYADVIGPGSPVQPGNFYLTTATKVTTNFQATMLGGFASPTKVAVSAGNTTSVPDLTVTAGVSSLSWPYVGVGAAGGKGDFNLSTAALPVPSGGAVDLLLTGGGVDATVGLQLFGKGVTLRPGTVRADTGPLAGQPLVRFTVDIAAVDAPTMLTVVVTKGASVYTVSGGWVIVPPKPTFVTAGVDSAASAQYLGAVSPGGISSIYDLPNVPNLGPATPVGNAGYDAYGKLSPGLAGVNVTFDGIPAPLFFVYGGQINLQVPFEVAGKTSTKVVVNYLGSVSAAVTVPVVAAQPAFFMINATDPFAANADYGANPKPNSATNPASRGTVMSVYGTGVGKVSYDIVTGAPAAGPPAGFTGGYNCSLGGKSMSVPFGGWTPTSVGLAQWSFIIPNDAATGAVSLKCTDTVSGASTQTATIYIK